MHNRSRLMFMVMICAAVIGVPGLSARFDAAGHSIEAAYAQIPEPTALIDAIFADLSAKTGRTLNRKDVQNYTYSQVQFSSSALNCPQPGVSYTQQVIPGYQVIITTRDNKVYDYRATLDGKTILLCGATDIPATVVATAAASLPAVPVTSGTATTFTNPIAYLGGDGNVYMTQASGQPIVALTNDAADSANSTAQNIVQKKQYSDLRWSPDNSKLLLVSSDDQSVPSIQVIQSGQPFKIVSTSSGLVLPPAWSLDSQSVVYALATQTPDNTAQPNTHTPTPASSVTTLYSARLDNAQSTTLGQITWACDNGGGDANSRLGYQYMIETQSLDGRSLSFFQTPGGIVYSTNCRGVGLALLKTGGAPGWNDPDLALAALSPDGTQLAALRFDTAANKTGALVKVDLNSGAETVIVPAGQASIDRLGWSRDGQMILYSTRTLLAQLTVPVTSPLFVQLFSRSPDQEDTIENTLSLYKVPAAGGQPQAIYSGAGYAIGLIAPTGDAQTEVISTIGSFRSVFDALANNQPRDAVQKLFPITQIRLVLIMNTTAANAPILVHGGRPAAAQGTFTVTGVTPQVIAQPAPPTAALPATVPATPVTPPALVIGGNALVTATGAVLNVRDTPSATGKIVRQLVNGNTVRIIGGPVSADNYRWWQVQLNNGVTGWAIDQFTDSTGTTDTLTPQ